LTSAGARAGISHTSRGQRKGGRASPVGRRRVRGDGDAAHHRADIRGQAVERFTDHGFETLALDIDHEVIVRAPSPAAADAQHAGCLRVPGEASAPGRTSISYECIEGAYESPMIAPSLDRSRATVCPQGSVRASCNNVKPLSFTMQIVLNHLATRHPHRGRRHATRRESLRGDRD